MIWLFPEQIKLQTISKVLQSILSMLIFCSNSSQNPISNMLLNFSHMEDKIILCPQKIFPSIKNQTSENFCLLQCSRQTCLWVMGHSTLTSGHGSVSMIKKSLWYVDPEDPPITKSLSSTAVIECPALALSCWFSFCKKIKFATVQFLFSGSKICKSLKQLAAGPLPPNQYIFSFTLIIVIPALGEGGTELSITSVQMDVSISNW